MKAIIGTAIFFVVIIVYNSYLRFGNIALVVSLLIGFFAFFVAILIYALRN